MNEMSAVSKDRGLATEPITIDETHIDIYGGEQMTEHFLTEVNLEGTVPVLANPGGLQPSICDSLGITHFLGKMFSSLYPTPVEDSIKQLLQELHNISYFSLTFNKTPQRATEMENGVTALLNDIGISDRYRQALEHKLEHVLRMRAPMLTDEVVANEEGKASSFLHKIDTLLAARTDNNSIWIFGTDAATALDAHVVPFVSRLIDVQRKGMVPPGVLSYVTKVFELPVWKEFMRDRKTIYSLYLRE